MTVIVSWSRASSQSNWSRKRDLGNGRKESHSVLNEPIDANRKVNIDAQLGSHFSPLFLVFISFFGFRILLLLPCPFFIFFIMLAYRLLFFSLVDSSRSLSYYTSLVCVSSDVHIVCCMYSINRFIKNIFAGHSFDSWYLDSHENFMSFPNEDSRQCK